jgi:hypothetical protein
MQFPENRETGGPFLTERQIAAGTNEQGRKVPTEKMTRQRAPGCFPGGPVGYQQNIQNMDRGFRDQKNRGSFAKIKIQIWEKGFLTGVNLA